MGCRSWVGGIHVYICIGSYGGWMLVSSVDYFGFEYIFTCCGKSSKKLLCNVIDLVG